MSGWFLNRAGNTESPSPAQDRFQSGLLVMREQADARIFWLLVSQWAVILSTSIAMATRWQSTRLDTLSAAVVWVGILSVLPLVLVLRSPGTLMSRWSVVISQSVMSTLLWYVSGGRPDTHLHLFAWLVVVAMYRDVAVVVATAGISVLGHVLVVSCCTMPALPSNDIVAWSTQMVWLAWLVGETAFMTTFVILDRQGLRAHVEKAQALEAMVSHSKVKLDEVTQTLVRERDSLKEEVSTQAQHQLSLESARFEAARELMALRREIAEHGTAILKLCSRPADAGLSLEWRNQWKALRQQAQQMMKSIELTALENSGSDPDPVFDVRRLGRQSDFESASKKDEKRAMLLIRNPLQEVKARQALELDGYTVEVVPHGPRAYYSAMLTEYSLIIVDIDLPGEEGYDTLEALRLLPPSSTASSKWLFALTNEKTPERVLQCTDLGVDGIFLKPLKLESLRQALSGPEAAPKRKSSRSTRSDAKAHFENTDSSLRRTT
jgi:CheY-like chemotaxis protein